MSTKNDPRATSRFYLNSDCFLIKGAKRGAIYNLSSGEIFSVDHEATELLERCEKGGVIHQLVDEIARLQIDDVISYLQQLVEMRLGVFCENNQIIHKIPTPAPEIKLDLLWLELTSSCNQTCLHCYNNSSPQITDERKSLLSYEDWIRVIREGRFLHCERLQFTGGEPLFFGKQIFNLAGIAKDAGYKQLEMFTNAVLFSENDIELLVKYDIRVATNIYSKRPEIHDQITGLKGSFEKTIRNIKMMRDKGVKVYIATILMKQNEVYREETVDFIKELGELMPLKHFDVVRPAGRGRNSTTSSKNLEHLLQKKQPVFAKITKEKFLKRLHGHSCWWGNAVVTCRGRVMPCIMASGTELGDIKKQSLPEIIKGASLRQLWKTSKDKVGVCKDCEYRYACLDCRPLATEMGEEYSRGKVCLYDPYNGAWGAEKTRKEG